MVLFDVVVNEEKILKAVLVTDKVYLCFSNKLSC